MKSSILLIKDRISSFDAQKKRIKIPVERRTLAKKRWRGNAADETDFGFDLEHPLKHGNIVYEAADCVYEIEQLSESVLCVQYSGNTALDASRGWLIGNTHFPAQFTDKEIVVEDDSAVVQMLERQHIPFIRSNLIFQPLSAGHHRH